MKDLDLDRLAPQPGEVTIGGEKLPVGPPTLRTLITLNRLSQKINDVTVDTAEADELQTELTNELNKIIPGLDKHTLSITQQLAICDLIGNMALPEQVKAAESEAGKVTPDPKADGPSVTP